MKSRYKEIIIKNYNRKIIIKNKFGRVREIEYLNIEYL